MKLQGPRSKDQWIQAILLVESLRVNFFKGVSQDEKGLIFIAVFLIFNFDPIINNVLKIVEKNLKIIFKIIKILS